MPGEDLHVAALLDSEPPGQAAVDLGENRIVDLSGCSVRSAGGRLHGFSLSTGIAAPGSLHPLEWISSHRDSVHFEVPQINAWDLPVWLATGHVDSIVTLRPELRPQREPQGHPYDELLFPEPWGTGRFREFIYYQILNAGIQLPPVAASGSGASVDPPGTYRTYVQLGDAFSLAGWWQGLRRGRVVVTNGPLMLPLVNQQYPGHTFSGPAGTKIVLNTSLTLHTREKIDYIQFIKNGESVAEVRLDEKAQQGQRTLPAISFEESGWLIIRAVTNNPVTYQLASTGPFYVRIGDTPRISRSAAQFFYDWLVEAAQRLQVEDDPQRDKLLPHFRTARDFWKSRLQDANTE